MISSGVEETRAATSRRALSTASASAWPKPASLRLGFAPSGTRRRSRRSRCRALGRVTHTVGQVDPRSPFSRTQAIPSTCSKWRSADTRSAPVSMA